MVSTAMVLMRNAPDAPSVLPGLNPNQPKARMKQPVRTMTMSCPGMALEEPSRLYLPMRGPTIKSQSQRGETTHRMHHPRAGKVGIAGAQSIIGSELREPSAAPRPVGEHGISDRAQEHGRDAEGDILPALGCGTGHDGQRRVHEDHLEQEQHHHADVIGRAREEEPLSAPQAPVVSQQVNGELVTERTGATQHGRCRRRRPSE